MTRKMLSSKGPRADLSIFGQRDIEVNVKTVAQAIAYLLGKSDEPLTRLKVQKLLYLADRECLDQTGFPITNDSYFHMKFGPVLSHTLNLMSGDSKDEYWDQWVWTEGSNDNNQLICVQAGNYNRDTLDHLSDFEIGVLDDVWEKFGGMEPFALSDYTHTLPEHIPTETREHLPVVGILVALGYDQESARDQAADIVNF